MKKKPKDTKKSNKALIKPLVKEEVKEVLTWLSTYDLHPDEIYKKFWKTIATVRSWEKDEDGMEYIKSNLLKLDDFSHNHTNLANTVPTKMATAVVELANNLIDEYKCKTSLEKTLCEIIANSYGKVMSISKSLDSCLIFDYFWAERNGFIAVMSKELDRANRNYLNALNNLIELKRPQMNISIKTKNAFVWTNQQFNNNPTPDENIKG